MSPPPFSSLLDPWQRVHIDCCRCSHRVVMAPEEAIAKFGADMTFPRLKRILKCAACGALGREHDVTAYPNSQDYSAWLERQEHARHVEIYGQAEADRLRALKGQNLLRQ